MQQPRVIVEFRSAATVGTKTTRKPTPDEDTTETTNVTDTANKDETETEAERNARRYKTRDEHEMFFRGRTGTRKQPARKCKKTKPRPLTNKERAAFAREHYERHHGKGSS